MKFVYQCTSVYRTVFDSDMDSYKSKFFDEIDSKAGHFLNNFGKLNPNSGPTVCLKVTFILQSYITLGFRKLITLFRYFQFLKADCALF